MLKVPQACVCTRHNGAKATITFDTSLPILGEVHVCIITADVGNRLNRQ